MPFKQQKDVSFIKNVAQKKDEKSMKTLKIIVRTSKGFSYTKIICILTSIGIVGDQILNGYSALITSDPNGPIAHEPCHHYGYLPLSPFPAMASQSTIQPSSPTIPLI